MNDNLTVSFIYMIPLTERKFWVRKDGEEVCFGAASGD